MQHPKGEQHEALYDARKTILLGLAMVEAMAGSHRLVHYLPGTPGVRAIDRWPWIGAGVAFPLFISAWPPVLRDQQQLAFRVWTILLALAAMHATAAYWSRIPRHSREIGQPLWGRLEIPVALGFAWLADKFCGPGAGYFLALGLACNLIQRSMIRARSRRIGALRNDARYESEDLRHHTR